MHTVAISTRCRCGAPVSDEASAVSRSTSPAQTASADNQSRADGQRRCSPDASDSTNSSCAAISGWTAATDPTLSAAAWVPTPHRFVIHPTSQVLFRTRRPSSRIDAGGVAQRSRCPADDGARGALLQERRQRE